jgi:hypothetical protein
VETHRPSLPRPQAEPDGGDPRRLVIRSDHGIGQPHDLGNRACSPSTRQNPHQAINRTMCHYAGALGSGRGWISPVASCMSPVTVTRVGQQR